MKKIIIILASIFLLQISIWAIPAGKYSTTDESSYVIVSGERITLYIGLHSAGSFSVLSEESDGTFTFTDTSGELHKVKWYVENGVTYLKLGSLLLVKCD